ncbi:MAG: hypothetical protein HC890_06350 [Chloroflexaceae bacterium]|nr:hypothetical protein [Chloroflexaceae bacterium]
MKTGLVELFPVFYWEMSGDSRGDRLPDPNHDLLHFGDQVLDLSDRQSTRAEERVKTPSTGIKFVFVSRLSVKYHH